MAFSESMRRRIEELDLERRLAIASEQGRQAMHRAVESAGSYAHQHRTDIAAILDKAGGAVDRRTDGKYAARVGTLKAQLNRGVARLADRRPTDPGPDPGGPGSGPTDPAPGGSGPRPR